MSTGKVVLGTLAGLAIGGIAGILFAPEKGSETRKRILEKSNDYMDELQTKFNEVRDSLAGQLESTKKDAEYLAKKGKAKYEDAKKDVKDAATNFKQYAAANSEHVKS